MVQLYYGTGKGKTTAAVGQAVRAVGQGLRVLFLQFLKDGSSGEIAPLRRLGVTVQTAYPYGKFFGSLSPQQQQAVKLDSAALFDRAARAMQEANYQMVVLDELVDACRLQLVDFAKVSAALAQADRSAVEVVITGHQPDEAFLALADYLSDIQAVRHPYATCQLPARRGIEY